MAFVAVPATATAAPPDHAQKGKQGQHWKQWRTCLIPVTPCVGTFTPCPAKFNRSTQVQIADGQLITITPGFDNQFRTPFADGQQLAIMLDGRFTGWTGVGNGAIVMVQPTWPDVTRGKQRIAFYDTNSRLVGWDWIKVDWSW